jgi:hypothetical protein
MIPEHGDITQAGRLDRWKWFETKMFNLSSCASFRDDAAYVAIPIGYNNFTPWLFQHL